MASNPPSLDLGARWLDVACSPLPDQDTCCCPLSRGLEAASSLSALARWSPQHEVPSWSPPDLVRLQPWSPTLGIDPLSRMRSPHVVSTPSATRSCCSRQCLEFSHKKKTSTTATEHIDGYTQIRNLWTCHICDWPGRCGGGHCGIASWPQPRQWTSSPLPITSLSHALMNPGEGKNEMR
jgi:hypothetical protein